MKNKQSSRSSSETKVEFNINDDVMVKLTDYGRECLHKNYKEFESKYGIMPGYPYLPTKEDSNGWSQWQMWDLMQKLGKYITMGVGNPFETTIKIIIRK